MHRLLRPSIHVERTEVCVGCELGVVLCRWLVTTFSVRRRSKVTTFMILRRPLHRTLVIAVRRVRQRRYLEFATNLNFLS